VKEFVMSEKESISSYDEDLEYEIVAQQILN
jgi:hypothetical protein